jgi:hypothetical protein
MKRFLILLIFVSSISIGCQIGDKPTVSLINNAKEGAGVYGPITLNFKDPLLNGSIEKGIEIDPLINIKFQWQGTQLNIFPDTFFSYDQNYQITIGNSGLAQNVKNSPPEYYWNIRTHSECLLYIGSANKSPEIWKICLNDNSSIQLSKTQGRIFDFNISDDGKMIVYTIKNDLGGTDIWLMDRNGKGNRILYKCNEDLCLEPTIAPDESRVVFFHSSKNQGDLAENNRNEILIIDILSGNKSDLVINKNVKATLLQWSTDQKYISFFDSFSFSFWIVDVNSDQAIELPSGEGLGGSWNRFSPTFLYSGLNYWGGIPFGQISEWNEKTNSIQHLFGNEKDLNEYFYPQWRPQGDWIAASFRPIEGSASKQIALFSKDGKKWLLVTNEQTYSYSSFSWSINGEKIAFQRFQMGVKDSVPEIGLWMMNDQTKVIIEKNASSPKWIP